MEPGKWRKGARLNKISKHTENKAIYFIHKELTLLSIQSLFLSQGSQKISHNVYGLKYQWCYGKDIVINETVLWTATYPTKFSLKLACS
jgi:hypothetical protein